ncbi:MAG: hypothetical protein N3G80_01285 [Candidatus Micrarchaeota archaeon]|nr:hypothetical protein [Candidatus Micrarchaeota archaeon]
MKAILFFFALVSLLFAGIDNVKTAISSFCSALVNNILPIVTMLMIVFAAVVYAGGQMMGAETRARANVWATAALVGAIIGILIITVSPPVLKAMYGKDISCVICPTGQQACGVTCCTSNQQCCEGSCIPASQVCSSQN